MEDNETQEPSPEHAGPSSPEAAGVAEPPRNSFHGVGAPRVPEVLEPGTRLDDRYEVVRLLGQGGMASVYEVRHLGLQSTHALKVLDTALLGDADLRNRFLAEGRIQAQLRHPNVVAVTEIVTRPVAGLVMEYVEGPDLARYLQDLQGAPPVSHVLELIGPVLDAVGSAHAKGIVHRDLKPENIIVARDSRGLVVPKVTDFGIAKVLDDASVQTGKRKTAAQVQMGTFLYMSPEQVRHSSAVDARSDVFALGAILYEIVTRRPAFEAPSQFDTMKRIVEGTFEPPERVVGELHPVIAGCIRKALAVDPAERFQSCFDFREALEAVRNPQAVPLAKPSRSYAVTVPPTARPHLQPAEPLSRASPPPVPVPAPRPGPAVPVQPPLPPVHGRPAVRQQPFVPAGALPPEPKQSPVLAAVLGLLCISGAGQLYNGQTAKGLAVMAVVLTLACATAGGAAVVANIILCVDAYAIAKKRQVQPVGKWDWF